MRNNNTILGQYEDLVTRVTNFGGEDRGFMVLAGDVFDVPLRTDIIQNGQVAACKAAAGYTLNQEFPSPL
jgi:hypothetical protein